MSNIFKKKVITEYGEIISEEEGKYYSPFKEDEGYNFRYKSNCIKNYLDIELPNIFGVADTGRIYRMSRKIYGSSNLLARRKNGKIVPYTKADIKQIIDLTSRNKFNQLWNKLINYKIIKEIDIDGDKYYCFNPIYFNSTRYIPLYLYIAFQDELKELLPSWVVRKYLEMEQVCNNGK